VLTDGELAAIWQATGDGDFGLIVRMCLWTGARRSEVGSMCWSELADGVWTVSGSRTKNHRPLVLPLPRQALAALQEHPSWVGRDRVFGQGPRLREGETEAARQRRSAGFQSWSQSKARLDRRLGFARPWDLHDLRRTVETRLRALGTGDDAVSRILNHAMGPVRTAYDRHDYLAEKAVALQAWADQLQHIGDTRKSVLELRAAP
jgi:integrase